MSRGQMRLSSPSLTAYPSPTPDNSPTHMSRRILNSLIISELEWSCKKVLREKNLTIIFDALTCTGVSGHKDISICCFIVDKLLKSPRLPYWSGLFILAPGCICCTKHKNKQHIHLYRTPYVKSVDVVRLRNTEGEN